jgi:hypothetical protein
MSRVAFSWTGAANSTAPFIAARSERHPLDRIAPFLLGSVPGLGLIWPATCRCERADQDVDGNARGSCLRCPFQVEAALVGPAGIIEYEEWAPRLLV